METRNQEKKHVCGQTMSVSAQLGLRSLGDCSRGDGKQTARGRESGRLRHSWGWRHPFGALLPRVVKNVMRSLGKMGERGQLSPTENWREESLCHELEEPLHEAGRD